MINLDSLRTFKPSALSNLKLGVPLARPVRRRDLRSRKTLAEPVAHNPHS